ncbi:hypothetical protein F4677DRAFT_410243 [Hypoxylon crocopeplum]|nr:hypothetical protein F4677DRAFT_410243 [Hypoxylon crocopeplum]
MAPNADTGASTSSTRQSEHKIGPDLRIQRTAPSTTTEEPTLRYRKTPVILLVIYLPTLIVPWVLTCIMTKRPLGGTSYYDQTSDHYESNAVGVLISQMLRTINAVLAVPIISTLLAHAAIVHAMRRRVDQKLNMQQLFALADKGWSNYPLLWTAHLRDRSSRFLYFAALHVLLGAILQPLTSVLVTFETIAAVSCLDIPIDGCSLLGPMTVGFDPEPADMPRLERDLILQDVLGHLVTVSDLEPQPNLWPINPDKSGFLDGYVTPLDRRMFSVYSADGGDPEGFFVTALENGTNTGVLREHAIRLNSSVHCEHIPESDFPLPCQGGRPFEIGVERPGLKLNVCVPGNSSQFPFTSSRHRQDITEDLYIHLEGPHNLTYIHDNFTVHCTVSTSRGYFELGNQQNLYVYGPLLDRWPDPHDIATNFNDFRGVSANFSRPTEEDPPTTDSSDYLLPFAKPMGSPFNEFTYERDESVPGPLMISAEVMFGNYSFLQFITDNTTNMTSLQSYASVCEHGRFPFSQVLGIITLDSGPESYCGNVPNELQFRSDNADDRLSQIITSHARIFNNTQHAEYAIMMSMYFANRAVLTKTVLGTRPFDAREIYGSPGSVMVRPIMATASLVVITVLIFLQTLGLALVIRLIYSVPTWASAFDAMEVARIGKALADDDLPLLGPVTRKDEERLAKIDGLIGIVTKDQSGDSILSDEDNEARDTSVDVGPSEKTSRVELALGGKGLITRRI